MVNRSPAYEYHLNNGEIQLFKMGKYKNLSDLPGPLLTLGSYGQLLIPLQALSSALVGMDLGALTGDIVLPAGKVFEREVI